MLNALNYPHLTLIIDLRIRYSCHEPAFIGSTDVPIQIFNRLLQISRVLSNRLDKWTMFSSTTPNMNKQIEEPYAGLVGGNGSWNRAAFTIHMSKWAMHVYWFCRKPLWSAN